MYEKKLFSYSYFIWKKLWEEYSKDIEKEEFSCQLY